MEQPQLGWRWGAARPLEGRVALVTGVSRDGGIAATAALRLHDLGAVVHASGWPAHDQEQSWAGARLPAMPFEVADHDLENPDAAAALVDDVVNAHGRLDIVVAAHARSSHQSFSVVDSDELDRCWAINVRSIVLLAQRFAQVHEPSPASSPPSGRMLWFTSGQHHGPMDGEIAYAVSKGALHQMTLSVDHALSSSRIIANCINPGPVDTGWADPAAHQMIAEWFPDHRWGTPDDVANLIAFLVTDQGSWIRGQVIDSEGGFNRLK